MPIYHQPKDYTLDELVGHHPETYDSHFNTLAQRLSELFDQTEAAVKEVLNWGLFYEEPPEVLTAFLLAQEVSANWQVLIGRLTACDLLPLTRRYLTEGWMTPVTINNQLFTLVLAAPLAKTHL